VAARASLPLDDVRELLAYAAFDGSVERISSELAYARDVLDDVVARVRAHFARAGTLAVADMKDACGVSRKHAVPLLEWLDRQGYTSRRGDARVAGRALPSRR
jgi:selenocysteine-specific elongation factor